ncbi:putative adenylate kinase 7-like [Scophthalmus maximus]|uniref:Putative adenylate kinase 7-like n=1 Tax=Scophthalmus maximus TaxID=52904 RepID=A0A2U9D093_SCOMX|nr:putative adenylate kinase 7-like [Scophthalmus maximus]
MGDEQQQTGPQRIFVSDVDRYSSKHIAKFLSTCLTEGTPEEDEASPPGEPAFRVVGSVSSSSKRDRTSFVQEQYVSPSQDELLQHLLECDVVVYNISDNATQEQVAKASWAITALHAEQENFKSQKMFILVSTLMTWAMTKPQDPDETDYVLSEEEFRRRRPHPSFKDHNDVEKLVLKLGRGKKSKLAGYVVASGLQYGMGENLFHYFFKVSWMGKFPKVPVFGEGTNNIPMIHVNDLAGVIQNIIELKPKSKYTVAVDDSKNTLEEIIKMISNTLGPGEIINVPEQEAIATKAFEPEELQFLSVNLRLDVEILKESFNIQWTSESGLVENMDVVVEEYKNTRQLHPIRIFLVGPPSVGKTTVAERLCRHYQIHHIRLKEVIEEKITQLKELLNENDAEHVSEEVAAAAQAQLDNINKSMEKNAGRLDDHLVFEIFREKLNSKPCRNQGFILDGFPKTYAQAQFIFEEDEMDEDTEDQDVIIKKRGYNKKITPEHVIALEASDDFLTKRVQGLTESVAEKMRYTQDEFLPRLTRYRQLSGAEESLLDFFDELEIHPEHMEVTTDDLEYTDVVKKITVMVGVPKNYGLSPEEQEEVDRKKEKLRRQTMAAEAAENKRRNETALAAMAAPYEEWKKNVAEVKRQEHELLEAHSLPLRNYLMKYVMPSLSEAMLEGCKVRPEDPVDFLAEHLLQNNQED